MCNTCGCKAAEENSVKKYRTPTKKQRQLEDEALMDVDYMREKFQAMERFPAGQHDIDEARRVLEAQYPNIQITDTIYMTKKSGNSNAFHIFMETNRGGFNIYGRIGYPEPKIYGPMSNNQYNSKITKKAKSGYSRETAFSAEGESHDYTPETYDPLAESPQTYDPMSESYSAENVLFIDKTGEETIMDEFIDEGEDYEDAQEYARKAVKKMNAEGRKRRYGKRQRFDHIKGNSRYLARDAKGRWISNVGVSGSIKQDLRSNAHSKQPVGFRGLGDSDSKHAEGMVLTDAIVQWEDGFGTSSPSAPPVGIHFGAEAYTDMYPQNSAEVDGMTGNGVPVAYGSGSSQYVEPPVRMGAETDSFAAMPGGVYGDSSVYKINEFERSDISGTVMYQGRIMPCMICGAGARMVFGSREDPFFVCDARDCLSKTGDMALLQVNTAEEGMNYMHEDFIPNSYGEDSALTSGRGVPVWYGSAETLMAEGWQHFEAMEVFPPSYDGDLANSMSRIREKYPRAQVKSGTTPIYLTKRQGSMNRFHFFIETSVGNFNVYGRIGYPKPQVYGPMTQGIYADKMRTKLRKGYTKTKNAEAFENPMIDEGYYPNSFGESSAVISSNGVPQWYGSAENIVLEKPIETGAKLGLGFVLMSAGVTLASVVTGMLLGE